MVSQKYFFLLLLLLYFFMERVICAEKEEDLTAEQLYQRGVDNYLYENWGECKEDFNAALKKYKRMINAITDCRTRCSNDNEYEYLNPQDIEDMHFYEKMIRRTLCFMQCTRIYYKDVKFDKDADVKVLNELENGEIYMYLQSCYLKDNEIQNAASAAFTYLTLHPDDKATRISMEFYLKLPGINVEEITNFEAEEYFPLYLKGVAFYNENDWEHAVAYIEEAIREYFAADKKCRVLCEGSFDQGWFPDFVASISNHFTYCLRCKQRCSEKLKTLDGLKGEQLLANFYNYLQFAYYKLRKYPESFRCVASYLLIYPNDEDMLYNKKIYRERGDELLFEPRPEIVYYMGRDKYEKKLLKFIYTEFSNEMKLRDEKIKEPTILDKSIDVSDKHMKKIEKTQAINPFKKYTQKKYHGF